MCEDDTDVPGVQQLNCTMESLNVVVSMGSEVRPYLGCHAPSVEGQLTGGSQWEPSTSGGSQG